MSTITSRIIAAETTPSVSLSRKLLEWGGIIAGVVLIAFGTAAIVMGIDGRSTVRDSLAAEMIVGSDNMTPEAVRAEVAEAGLADTITDLPTKSVAGQEIDTGNEARTFAEYLRVHALESSGGLTYAQMGRFAVADGNPAGTNDEAAAVKGEDGRPVSNAPRNTWVTATALTTALNTSYMAEKLALFGMVVGVALLLAGIGFIVLAVGGALRRTAAEKAAA